MSIKERINSNVLLERLNIPSLDSLLRYNRLRWFGHVERSNGWIKRCTEVVVVGNRKRGRPKKRWSDIIKEDRKLWSMSNTDTGDRSSWRKTLRTGIEKRATCI